MSDDAPIPPPLSLTSRVAEISDTRRRALHGAAGRTFKLLLPVQWLASILLCLMESVSSPGGGFCHRGLTLGPVILFSSLINGVAFAVIQRAIDRPSNRYIIAASQVLFYILLTCIGAGNFDTHLYLFVALGFLAFYRDRQVLVVFAGVCLGAQWAYSGMVCSSPYTGTEAQLYHFLVFVFWVLLETFVLMMVCKRGSELFINIGREQAQLELERERSHREVLERTRQLEATNEQYRALLESTSAVPWELDDSTGACRYIGSQVEHHWGWPAESFQQQSFLFSCIHPDDRPAFAQALEEAVATHEVAVECRLQLKSEKIAYIRSFIRHAPNAQGRIVRGISIDITTQKQLETELAQAQKLESVGRLAAGIAHEINTPVQFVNDNCYFLRDAVGQVTDLMRTYQHTLEAAAAGELTVEQARTQLQAAGEAADLDFLSQNMPTAVERSLEGLDRVATIVRSMKEFSHPDQTAASSADLNAAIQSTLTIARNEYKYVADIETHFGDIPLVICRVGELNQAFLNILVNAAHAIGDVVTGTDRRGLITITTQQDGEDVLITVQDTGGGIPPAIRDKIFDPFFTTKEVGKGTGQGLPISRSVIVDKHQGKLTFETQPGIGTTFFIRLPIQPPQSVLEGVAAA